MNEEIKQLSIYLDALISDPTCNPEKPKFTVLENIELLKKVELLHAHLQEVYKVSSQLADGDLKINICSDNLYAGALKDLQSGLKHLIWQVGRVAEGDYGVNVNFFGDFTNSFKKLVCQLQEREDTLKENTILNEMLARQQMQLLENELERSADKYDQFAKSMAEIRSYRHDMQNHLLCIDSLLQDQDYEGVERYVRSLTDIFTIMSQSEKSENYILDALLNDKLEKAKQLHVKLDKKIVITRKLNIDNKDWCILIGNALDNSIEALQKVEQSHRELIIKLSHIENMLSVQIINTMTDTVTIKNNHIETSKSDKVNHGIGLKNIEKTVHKYNGEMNIRIENNKFHLTFLLCNI